MRFVFFLAILIAGQAIATEIITGKVTRVVDGDTLIFLDEFSQQHRIRLAYIDAPETRQSFSRRSTESLEELCLGANAKISVTGVDRYERITGQVFCRGQDANLAQVERGMAHLYPEFLRAERRKQPDLVQRYFAAGDTAHRERKGLWVDPAPVLPKEFRRAAQRY